MNVQLIPRGTRAAAGLVLAAGLLALLAGCATPQAPVRPQVYDFGPGQTAPMATSRIAPLPALALAEIEAPAALDSTAMLYRLAYADSRELKPYALAQWSMAPAQLVRQRLRELLGQRRAVLNAGEPGAAWLLRLELEEFSQVHDTAASSAGLLKLRATLSRAGGGQAEQFVAQRAFIVSRPAAASTAAAGARALAEATEAFAGELDAWLQQAQR